MTGKNKEKEYLETQREYLVSIGETVLIFKIRS